MLLKVTQTYSPVTARADHSLLQYGFVEDVPEPLLAAVDSATGFDMEDDTWYGRCHALPVSLQLLQRKHDAYHQANGHCSHQLL